MWGKAVHAKAVKDRQRTCITRACLFNTYFWDAMWMKIKPMQRLYRGSSELVRNACTYCPEMKQAVKIWECHLLLCIYYLKSFQANLNQQSIYGPFYFLKFFFKNNHFGPLGMSEMSIEWLQWTFPIFNEWANSTTYGQDRNDTR